MAETLKERGFFWWFNEPNLPARSLETSIPGLLTIMDDGRITLQADGSLCLKDEYQSSSEDRWLPESRRVAGVLASSERHDSFVLLEGLLRTDWSFPHESPQQQEFVAQLCTSRNSPFPDDYSTKLFTELRIELDGFEDWLGLESIMVDREYSQGEKVNVHVTYKEWKLEYPIPEGTILIESVTTGVPLFSFSRDIPSRIAEFRQYYYLIFKPDSPSDAANLRHIYTKTEELLALLTGTYSRLRWPILTTQEEELPTWNTLHFFRGTSSGEPISRSSAWVPFSRVRDAFGGLFKNWLARSESFGSAYYLYTSSLRSPHHYAEHRFVNLIWCVEALHRKWLGEPETSDRVAKERERVKTILSAFPDGSEDRKWLEKKLKYAHELSLEARILECLRELPLTFGKSEIEKFSKACADRRNDISHHGGPREDADYGSFQSDISQLADALDHLYHALLLHQIGVDTAILLKAMTDSIVSIRVKAALQNVGISIKSAAPQLSPPQTPLSS